MCFKIISFLFFFAAPSSFAGKDKEVGLGAATSSITISLASQDRSPKSEVVKQKSVVGQCCLSLGKKICDWFAIKFYDEDHSNKAPQGRFLPNTLGKNQLAYMLSFLLPKDIVSFAQTSHSWYEKLSSPGLSSLPPSDQDSVFSWRILSGETVLSLLEIFFHPDQKKELTRSILHLHHFKLFLGLQFIEFLQKKIADFEDPFVFWEKATAILKSIPASFVLDFSLFFRTSKNQKSIFQMKNMSVFSFFRHLPQILSLERCFDIRIASPYKDSLAILQNPLILKYVWDVKNSFSNRLSLDFFAPDLNYIKSAVQSLELSDFQFFSENEVFFKSCPNLKMLICPPLSFLQYGIQENKWKNLEKLELQLWKQDRKKEELVLEILPYFSELRSFTLHHLFDFQQIFFKKFPILKKLESFQAYHIFSFVTQESAHKLIQNQENLQFLRLGLEFFFQDCYEQFPQLLQDYCRNRKMTELFVSIVNKESFIHVLEALKALRHLQRCSINIETSALFDDHRYKEMICYLKDRSLKQKLDWKVTKHLCNLIL
jgi:hypothetical protein